MQTTLDFHERGGVRPGAGRKRSRHSGTPHLRRADIAARHPVHVTLRVGKGCWNLRSHRALRVLEAAFHEGRARFGFRLAYYSVQGNHLHLIVEAEGKESLSRGMKGLGVRVARALNRMMRRKGRVIGDRYHAHVLKTPRETARALRYVLMNFAHHAKAWGETVRATFIDPFSSVRFLASSPGAAAPVAEPGTWLLRKGWLGASEPSASPRSARGE
jgi:putative transposase